MLHILDEILTHLTDDFLPQAIRLSIADIDLDLLPEEELKVILETVEEAVIQQSRVDFYMYLLYISETIFKKGFKPTRVIRLICKYLQMLEEKKITKLMIMMPPRSGKTATASNAFVSWYMGKTKGSNVIHVGNSSTFAETAFSAPIRDILESQPYKNVFPDNILRKNVKSVKNWQTEGGNKYSPAGAGANITGKGGHLGILDDVLADDDKNEMKKINEWYAPVYRTRLQPEDHIELVINTRWNKEDISGHLLKLDKKAEQDIANGKRSPESFTPWTVLSIPAILDEDGAKLLDLPIGSSFCPERYSMDYLNETKNSMHPNKWSALYMQNPIPDEGAIVKPEWIRRWTDSDMPPLQHVLASFDTAFSTSEQADYSAFTVWGIFFTIEDGTYGERVKVPNALLLAGDRGRWEFPDLCDRVLDIMDEYNPDTLIIEKKASGQSLIQEMNKRGLPVMPYVPEKDKQARLHAVTPLFMSGRIWFPERYWVAPIEEELLSFPFDVHDDYVDTISQALNYLRSSWYIQEVEEVSEDQERLRYQQPEAVSYWGALS